MNFPNYKPDLALRWLADWAAEMPSYANNMSREVRALREVKARDVQTPQALRETLARCLKRWSFDDQPYDVTGDCASIFFLVVALGDEESYARLWTLHSALDRGDNSEWLKEQDATMGRQDVKDADTYFSAEPLMGAG